MADAVTAQFLWLLENLGEDNRQETACAMLGLAPEKGRDICEKLLASFFVEEDGGDLRPTDLGRTFMHTASMPFDSATKLGACLAEDYLPACEFCLDRMYESHWRGDGCAAAGWLDLLLARLGGDMSAEDTHRLARLALGATEAAIYYLRCTSRVNKILAKISDLARKAGNLHLLCQLTFGRGALAFYIHSANLREAHAICSQAQELLNSLDDADLRAICRPFNLLMHFLAGEYRQVMNIFESIRRSGVQGSPWPLLDAQTIILASSAAAYLGIFADATGMLASAADTAEIEGARVHALLYRQHLGVLQAYMHRPDTAQKTLENVLGDPLIKGASKVLLRAWMGVALCDARAGRTDKSHALLARIFSSSRHDLGITMPWNYPWMLELAVMFEAAGLPGLPELDFRKHLQLLMRSGNAFARGCAMRFLAERQFHMVQRPNGAIKLVDKAISLLEEAGAPLDEGMAWRFKAFLHQQQKEAERAAHAAIQAKIKLEFLGLGHLVGPVLPEGVEPRQSYHAVEPNSAYFFRRICAELGGMDDWGNLAEYCNGAAASLRRQFGASRAIIFRVTEHGLQGLGLCNITPQELGHDNFSPLLALADSHARSKNCAIKIFGQSVHIFVPFSISASDHWLLYLDGDPVCAHSCNEEDLGCVAAFCASHLRLVVRMENGGGGRPPAVVENISREIMVPGRSPAFSLCMQRADLVAPTDATVLLLGETGVGKEVLARYIHEQSGRSGPLVCVHPAAMNENLFENEFFGHEKGAFTGASGRKTGFCELADNGTLFIDEAGEIPLAMQSKLLRVLQEHRFTRVGGTREIKSSFRLLAATNRNLENAVAGGSFREDLYYRIAVFPIHIPPLRERPEDLEMLFRHYASCFARRYDKPEPVLDAETLERLKKHSWPGNIRELRNVVERAVILSAEVGQFLAQPGAEREKPAKNNENPQDAFADLPSMTTLMRRYAAHVLAKTGGRIDGTDGAASVLGMSRSTLYAKIREWGIQLKGRQKENPANH